MPHADALSRLSLPDSEPIEMEANCISHVDQCVEVLCCSISESSSFTSKDEERFTDRDPILSKVRNFVIHGWRKVTDPELANKKGAASSRRRFFLIGWRLYCFFFFYF